MKKESITIGVTLALAALVVAAFVIPNLNKENTLGQTSRVFTSAQLAPNPVDDYILSTNGATSTWIANVGGGGGASSTIITLDDGAQENVGVPTLDFDTTNLTVTESPADEFNISIGNVTGVTGADADDLSDDDLDALQNVAAMTESNGDILYYNSSAWQRLAAGSNGEVLKLSGGLPAWGTDLNTGSGGGLGTTTPWTVGDLVQVVDDNTVTSSSTISDSFIPSIIARDSELHDAVTLAGALDYLTISGQEITRGTIDFGDDTNAVGGDGITITGDSIAADLGTSIDSTEIEDGAIVNADVNNSAAIAYSKLNLTDSLLSADLDATNAEADNDILTVDTTSGGFTFNTPAELITAGTGLSWTGATLNAEVETTDLHDAVTLAGSLDYLTLSGQQITRNAIDLAADITGTLPVSNGGTGATTLTDGGILLGSGTGAITALGVATNGQIPIGDGTTDPVLATLTAGTGIDITNGAGTITIEATGGGGGGGDLSTTTEKIGAGASSTVSYVTDEFMLGGSASTSAEFLFDYASSTLEIRGNGTTTRFSTGDQEAVRDCNGERNSDDGWECTTGLEWDLESATVVLRGIGSTVATAITTALNWTFTGTVDLTSATVNFGAGAIDAITEIATALKTGLDATLVTGTEGANGTLGEWNSDGDLVGSGLATADVVTGASTDTFTNKTFDANGTGNSISNVDLTADVTGVTPVANGGTGTSTPPVFSVTVASTSVAFIGSGLLPGPSVGDSVTISKIKCKVHGGTSKVIAIEDDSANSSEDITCGTSWTFDDGSITNASYTPGEQFIIDFGATTGAVNYVTIEAYK